MKKMIFTLFIFAVLASAAMSTEINKCVDKEGNVYLTDNPPENVKCESNENETETDNASTNRQQQSGNENKGSESKEDFQNKKGEMKRLMNIPRVSFSP